MDEKEVDIFLLQIRMVVLDKMAKMKNHTRRKKRMKMRKRRGKRRRKKKGKKVNQEMGLKVLIL